MLAAIADVILPGRRETQASHLHTHRPELAAMRDTQVRPTEHGTKVGRCLTHTLSPARGTLHRLTYSLLPDRSSHRRRRRRTHSLFLVLASSAHTLQSKASREQVSRGRVCGKKTHYSQRKLERAAQDDRRVLDEKIISPVVWIWAAMSGPGLGGST